MPISSLGYITRGVSVGSIETSEPVTTGDLTVSGTFVLTDNEYTGKAGDFLQLDTDGKLSAATIAGGASTLQDTYDTSNANPEIFLRSE